MSTITNEEDQPAKEPFKFEVDTREEHIATLQRAKEGELSSIWSGDIRRSAYLRENIQFAQHEGFLTLEPYDDKDAQESGWLVTWTDKEII